MQTPFLLPLSMDSQFWEARYQEKQTGWDLGTVSPPLKAYFDQLTSKNLTILVPGCGFGHEIQYLASEGFTHVTALDLVEEPLALLKENCPQVTCIQGDLFTFEGSFDLIIEQTIFCAIDPAERERYMQKMASLLKPGGKYVGVLFDRTFESALHSADHQRNTEVISNAIFRPSHWNHVTTVLLHVPIPKYSF